MEISKVGPLHTMTSQQPVEKPGAKKGLYFKDPFMDLGFLHTLTLHGFKASELGECYSAAADIRDGDVESYKVAWNDRRLS
jgi:hypothetical protein